MNIYFFSLFEQLQMTNVFSVKISQSLHWPAVLSCYSAKSEGVLTHISSETQMAANVSHVHVQPQEKN